MHASVFGLSFPLIFQLLGVRNLLWLGPDPHQKPLMNIQDMGMIFTAPATVPEFSKPMTADAVIHGSLCIHLTNVAAAVTADWSFLLDILFPIRQEFVSQI